MDKPSEIRIRIFGSKECERCEAMTKLYTSVGLGFDFVDVNAEENDALCDSLHIDALPEIQAYVVETGKVIMKHVGFLSPTDLALRLKDISSNTGDPNMNLRGIRGPAKGCNGCNDKQNSPQ
jgi:thioredoxin-like negative regulator of GroEL